VVEALRPRVPRWTSFSVRSLPRGAQVVVAPGEELVDDAQAMLEALGLCVGVQQAPFSAAIPRLPPPPLADQAVLYLRMASGRRLRVDEVRRRQYREALDVRSRGGAGIRVHAIYDGCWSFAVGQPDEARAILSADACTCIRQRWFRVSLLAEACIQSDGLGQWDFHSEQELQYGLNVIECGLGCHFRPERSGNKSDGICFVLMSCPCKVRLLGTPLMPHGVVNAIVPRGRDERDLPCKHIHALVELDPEAKISDLDKLRAFLEP
jgi:hypothetical protein